MWLSVWSNREYVSLQTTDVSIDKTQFRSQSGLSHIRKFEEDLTGRSEIDMVTLAKFTIDDYGPYCSFFVDNFRHSDRKIDRTQDIHLSLSALHFFYPKYQFSYAVCLNVNSRYLLCIYALST